jgi:hypothetical protein
MSYTENTPQRTKINQETLGTLEMETPGARAGNNFSFLAVIFKYKIHTNEITDLTRNDLL